jgi:NAD(P)-dependent dehydrogenase (short-subunit alcohol dehydrogenase family)
MSSTTQKVALVIGASRGIGRQIAVDLAKNGYAGTVPHHITHPPSTHNQLTPNAVIVSAKSTSDAEACVPFPPDPNSNASTISTVCREIVSSGGTCVAIPCDVRSHASITSLVEQSIAQFSRIDVLVYNSGAIFHSSVLTTPLSRYMLMESVNPNGLYASIQACLPYWEKHDWKARIVVICPPIYSRFFRGKTAYAMGKVGMSVLVKGMAMDLQRMGEKGKDMAIVGLWPAVVCPSYSYYRPISFPY